MLILQRKLNIWTRVQLAFCGVVFVTGTEHELWFMLMMASILVLPLGGFFYVCGTSQIDGFDYNFRRSSIFEWVESVTSWKAGLLGVSVLALFAMTVLFRLVGLVPWFSVFVATAQLLTMCDLDAMVNQAIRERSKIRRAANGGADQNS
ncbi:MAG: hypothetical protein IPK50_14710 [Fibrobacterota bacterium]|nr:hypothetical protein [Fibrobacterota bacterium]QQS03546.1 MAG: hypothetical protein IPK50_14710 [Fibrobacterota bacterium]